MAGWCRGRGCGCSCHEDCWMSGGDENDFCDRLDGCKKKIYIYIQSIISSYACNII